MMTITTMISTREKPLRRRGRLKYIAGLQNGQNGGKQNKPYKYGQENNKDRFQYRGQPRGQAINLPLVSLGESVQHFFELAALLSDREYLDHHGRKDAGRRQSVADVTTGHHGIAAAQQGPTDDRVLCRSGGRFDSLQKDDAAFHK